MNPTTWFDKDTLKQIAIADYLAVKGIEPHKTSGNELVYFSPLTGERTPSFFVNPQKNEWNDFSSSQGGDIIKLVQLLENLNFQKALEFLQNLDVIGVALPLNIIPLAEKTKIKRICDLRSPSLIRYVESRNIPIALARKYLSEVHYTVHRPVTSSDFYGVGFRNEANGFELRNPKFKGSIGVKDYRYIKGKDSIENGCTVLILFEGFFDFLSFLAHKNLSLPPYDVIVLNSTALLEKALPTISLYSSLICYFDNDDAGRRAFTKIESTGIVALNASLKYFPSFNDYNDFLCQKQSIPQSKTMMPTSNHVPSGKG
jgi:DNA primase